MVLQGFWWDYRNANFPNNPTAKHQIGWANYLAELAPRLRGMGVDAVWIPPTIKNQDFGSKGVGYAPYDNYDLGDKFQKNADSTRLGTKDELLRMVAVLHANGIEVVQDIVPNHVIGAGSDNGGGGQDPSAPVVACTDIWKNFRYACYKTPATDQSATEYLSREGRFPKNWQNFNPSPAGGCTNLCDPNADPICWQGFGPDVAYFSGAHGLSGNAIYNPDQTTYSPYNNGGLGSQSYMRKHTREWLIWYKKQMGFDGVRVDAVKHFPNAACEDFLYNLQFEAGWANGGNQMFAVGEWVGGTSALDAWTAAMMNRAGTFDFNLRGFGSGDGLYGMIYGNGGYDLGNLPGAQQGNGMTGAGRWVDISGTRFHRTVPFVNNHDTYRPQTDVNGNITGWNNSQELAPHVDIREPRLAAAYAVMCAMDGNPQIFFEDLLNIANTGKRFSHQPTSTSDLPAHQDIVNIMKAHGALNFKGGSYKVRSSETGGSGHFNVLTSNNSDDNHIVIERSGKAIIGATDQWAQDQESWVNSDFPPGTVLMDYSGGISTTSTVQNDQRVNIKTRAVGFPSFLYATNYADHGEKYHGYSIWAPVGLDLNSYVNAAIPTTQEWEMEDDLGDSHCQSLRQGGRTPNNSPNARVVGKIFVDGGSTVSYLVTLGSPGTNLTVEFYDINGTLLHGTNGSTATLSGSFNASSTGWVVAKVRNTAANTNGQKCWVRLSYNAPATVDTDNFPGASPVFIWSSNGGSNDWNDCRNWEEGRIPACAGTVIVPHAVLHMPSVPTCFAGTFINRAGLSLRPKAFLQGPYNAGLMADNLRSAGLVPTLSPYGDGASTTAGVLALTGNDAIVDWVRIELRDPATPATVLHTRSALIQRDGDVVGTDGRSPVFFNAVASGNYHVAMRHRNHLGAMTATARSLGTSVDSHNFSTSASFGTNAQKEVASGIFALWACDVDNSGTIDAADRSSLWNNRNQNGYLVFDCDLSGFCDASDRSLAWNNRNVIQQLP